MTGDVKGEIQTPTNILKTPARLGYVPSLGSAEPIYPIAQAVLLAQRQSHLQRKPCIIDK